MNKIKQRFENLKKKKKKGFTLIELVVVIAIMAILALIMVPNLTAYVGKADTGKIRANLKTIHTAAELVDKVEAKVEDPTYRDKVGVYVNIDNHTIYRDGQYIVVSYTDKKGEVHTFNGLVYSNNEGETPVQAPNVPAEIDGHSYSDYGMYLYNGMEVYWYMGVENGGDWVDGFWINGETHEKLRPVATSGPNKGFLCNPDSEMGYGEPDGCPINPAWGKDYWD